MPFDKNISVIDLMINVPSVDRDSDDYKKHKELLRDKESLKDFKMPAQYMFKNLPDVGSDPDKVVSRIVQEMDRFNIGQAMIPLQNALRHSEIGQEYRDRFIFHSAIDPWGGMDELRRIRSAKKEHGIKALTYFPSASNPQVAINDRELYPIYATAIDLDLPIIVNVGVPGPRFPMRFQKVELIDEVCWFFPELKFVMRHGGEPWEDLAVKLMLKYPNLYYCTSGFAPKYYPRAIIDYANTRGADKIMYAGYFPAGLTLERIFAELKHVPFNDDVWPAFLRDNAVRVFNLNGD